MFDQELIVERVEALYKGYGETRQTIGVTVTANFTVLGNDYEVKVGIPGTVDLLPNVGDTITVRIG